MTGVNDNWEGNKRLGKDSFVEFLELRLGNANVVTSRIGQYSKTLPLLQYHKAGEDLNFVPVLPNVKIRLL